MDVYIEYVIICNLTINAMIGYLTLSVIKGRCSTVRILLSSVIGTVLAVVLPLIVNNIAVLAIKISTLPIVTLFLCKYSRVRKYIFTSLIYLTITAMLGGLIIMLRSMTDSRVYALIAEGNSLIAAYISGGVILCIYIIRQIRGYVACGKMTGSECDIYLTIKGRKLLCSGFIDTGNTLTYNGKGVAIIDGKTAKKLISSGAEKVGGIWVKTVSGEAYLKTIRIDRISFIGESETSVSEITAAVSRGKIAKYQVILPAAIRG
ncbi:MAG: sigma-E processing peptidase SpoIIGA [Clostridia bacterium]|nr:sigma-E processing peptidase SpoIIGA [Clostridia bacterium]